ncbi:MAG TPA: ABC transporter substrate-binding protein, partial [Nocardioides sp.]|nr:ABC transporter substrate-binding protein [Nocardioides sp.]
VVQPPFPPGKSGDFPMGLEVGDQLAQQYMKDHPGVTIKLDQWVPPAGQDADQWRLAQVQAGTSPHVMVRGIKETYTWVGRADFFVPITDHIEQPDPYVAGNKRWGDLLPADIAGRNKAPDGKSYMMPHEQRIGELMVYNKDVFDELGLKPFETWNQVFAGLEKVRTQGKYTPYDTWLETFPFNIWSDTLLTKGFLADVDQDKNGFYDIKEWTRVMRQGKFKADSYFFLHSLQLWKRLVPYFQKDWPTIAGRGGEGYKLFLAGKAAMCNAVPTLAVRLEADTARKFQFGFFTWPQLDRDLAPEFPKDEEMPYISSRRPDVNSMIVLKRAKSENLVDLAVDFIQYWTAPENFKKLLDEATTKAPSFTFIPVQGDLKPIRIPPEMLKGQLRRLYGVDMWGVRFYDDWFEAVKKYMGDVLPEDQAIKTWQGLIDKAAENAVKDFKWDEDDRKWRAEVGKA